ncbi:hypothetical protein EMIHUDRAFT_234772 [Emiliania huxleyi CCMP1516]|uniref:Amino acid transporter transmembrane domain-containing protein n=2 Tax=Emiliania huxleyi TaxID=2903 RepID=A0A0D3JYP7_EMIH1|nr:hypothetical protein EMIHUDRAFT_234772 [Emiliania huxleyi CCMP1516]EOD28632.1 hypothetical protein EMIHUDRAFT_234772 [Emiliania huxleyi CCMP1516]|eukprot:XP_005781061.1 hypothetical protein EMIHUDRAFT_234772 [Emiliania huxleyi CCMP1516]
MAPRSPLAAPLLGASEGQLSGIGFTAAVLSLVKGCIGAGVMALPWATIQGGAASAPALILLGAWNGYTGWLLLDCDAPGSYSDLVRLALGRGGVVLLEGSLLVVLFGVCVSFQVQAATLLSSLPSLGRLASHDVYALTTGAALLPLVLQRSFSGIAAISIAALAVLCLGLTAVGLWGLWAEGAPTLPPQLLEPPTAHGFADFLGVAAFSFGGQVFVLPVRDAMARPRLAATAVGVSTAAILAVYAAVGAGGASLFWRAGVKQLVLLNIEPGSLLTGILGCLANLSALLLPPLIHLRLRGRRPASAARPAAVRTALAATDALLLLAGFASCAGPALLIVQQLARRAGEEGPEGLPPALGESLAVK